MKLKPCPFCGETPTGIADNTDRNKWASVECGCGARGPDVRTGYDPSSEAPWKEKAAEEWNRHRDDTKVEALRWLRYTKQTWELPDNNEISQCVKRLQSEIGEEI